MRTNRVGRRLACALCAGAAVTTMAAVQLAAQGYRAPKTPWGDPDIQGNYTTLTEAGTPLERPKEFEGRQLSEVTGDELRKVTRASFHCRPVRTPGRPSGRTSAIRAGVGKATLWW